MEKAGHPIGESFALVASAAAAQPAGSGQAIEKNFDSMISSADQLAWLQQMSSAPNQVGSAHRPGEHRK